MFCRERNFRNFSTSGFGSALVFGLFVAQTRIIFCQHSDSKEVHGAWKTVHAVLTKFEGFGVVAE